MPFKTKIVNDGPMQKEICETHRSSKTMNVRKEQRHQVYKQLVNYWTRKEQSPWSWLKLVLVITKKAHNKSSTYIKYSKFGYNKKV